MTDPNDPLHSDALDELASAHLDGHTTAAEAERIAADAELTARVTAMAAVRAALQSDSTPVDDAQRDLAIAAALAAFDAAGDDASGQQVPPPVAATPIARGRRAIPRRTLRLVTVAAVAALLALAVPLLGRLDSDRSEDDLATSALEESDADAQQRDATGGDAAGGAAPLTPAPADTFDATGGTSVDLGTFDDLTALDAAVRPFLSRAATPEAAASTTADDGATTARPVCLDAPGATRAAPRVLTGTATVGDRPVVVFVYEGTDGAHEIVVVDAADCSVITTRTLDP